jgi:hypothetical protein
MTDSSPVSPLIHFSIGLRNNEVNLIANHDAIQTLKDRLVQMICMDEQKIEEVYVPERSQDATNFSSSASQNLTCGLKFAILPERLRITFRRLGDWIEEFNLVTDVEIRIPLSREFKTELNDLGKRRDFASQQTIRFQTGDIRKLTEVIFVAETLLASEDTYFNTARRYINMFGELTPSAQANLDLLQHQLDIPPDQAKNLDSRAVGPIRTLDEKYQRFKKGLVEESEKHLNSESEIHNRFWQTMEDKAKIMLLPLRDFLFLKSEYLKDKKRQEERRLEKRRKEQNEREAQLRNYEQSLRRVLLDGWHLDIILCNEIPFVGILIKYFDPVIGIFFFEKLMKAREIRQYMFEINSELRFNKVQIEELRKIYRISIEDARSIENLLLKKGGIFRYENKK